MCDNQFSKLLKRLMELEDCGEQGKKRNVLLRFMASWDAKRTALLKKDPMIISYILELLVQYKMTRAIKFLYSKGAKCLPQDVQSELLVYAIESNTIEIIKYLVKQGVRIEYAQDKYTYLLADAVRKDNLELVKFLIKNGIDYRGRDDFALRSAVNFGQFGVALYILKKMFADNNYSYKW